MPPAPQSHAEICQSDTGDDQGKRLAHIEDELARRSHPARALISVCFTAITAAAAENAAGPGPLLTFGTLDGKSLQVLLRIPRDQAGAFATDLLRILPRSPIQRRRGRPFPAE